MQKNYKMEIIVKISILTLLLILIGILAKEVPSILAFLSFYLGHWTAKNIR